MSTHDPRLLFETANDGAILIDGGDGSGKAYPYAQKSLYFEWDSVNSKVAIHLTAFDNRPIVPFRLFSDYSCYVDGALQTIATYQAFVDYVKTYLFQCCGGGTTGGATEAKQDDQITAAGSTNTKLDTLNTGVAGSNVILSDIQTSTASVAAAANGGVVKTGTSTVMVQQLLSITYASAYTAGDVIGGKTSFSLLRTSNGSAKLQSVCLVDKSNQKPNVTLMFFSENPLGTYADKTTFAWNATDVDKLLRTVSIITTSYSVIGSYAVADVTAIAKEIVGTSGTTNIWVVMVTTSTPTFSIGNGLTLKIGVIQD